MNLQIMPLGELAIWANKIESHIADLQGMLKTLQATKSHNKFFDNNSRRANLVINKLNELSAKLNEIYTEVDRRSAEQIGLSFEIQAFTDIMLELDGAYLKEVAKKDKEAKAADRAEKKEAKVKNLAEAKK